MRTHSTLFFLALVACSGPASPAPTSVAPPTTVAVAPTPEPAPTRPSWLYRVSTDSQPSFVFAMLDPGCPLFESFPAEYEILFRFARSVVVPIGWTDEQEHAYMLAHAVAADGHLDRDLGEERFARFVDVTEAASIAARLTPTTAMSLYTTALAASVYGTTTSDGRIAPGHDAALRRSMTGQPLVSLFTPDDVIATSERMRPSVVVATLQAYLDHQDELRTMFSGRLSAYRAGDEADVMRHAEEVTVPGTEAFAAATRTENQRLLDAHVEQIETELRTGNALVLLPVEGVLGDDGILARLRADHFEITRLSVAAPPE